MSDLSDTNKRARPLLLDPDAAWVPLGKATVVFVLCGGWAWHTTAQIDGAIAELRALNSRMAALERNTIEVYGLQAWRREFQASNPTLHVPEFHVRVGAGG